MKPKGKGSNAIEYLKQLKNKGKVKILNLYFTFGRYDGVIIFEAPNEEAAMKFVMETGFATQYTMETLVAVPAERL
jgi:uncharacterized protein with GYD domain